jgi:hypothetical protein
VFEVPTLMTSRERGARPGQGKTDPVAIVRITMREPDLPPVRLAHQLGCFAVDLDPPPAGERASSARTR